MRIFAGCLFLVLFSQAATAQMEAPFPLRGKTVAVYFSKKNFTYDDNYLIPLSQFVKAENEVAPTITDLKLQSLVALGNLFSAQLKSALHADSVFFLNENPLLAEKFLSEYKADQHYCGSLDTALSPADYIIVVNPLTLGSFKTSEVYSVSNRIITEQVIKKSGRLRLDVIEPVSGLMVGIYEACWSEQDAPPATIPFSFQSASSPTGKFLSHLFSIAVNNLNEGKKSNCEGK